MNARKDRLSRYGMTAALLPLGAVHAAETQAGVMPQGSNALFVLILTTLGSAVIAFVLRRWLP